MANLTTTELNVFTKETFDTVIQESFDMNDSTLRLIKKSTPTEGVTALGRKFDVKVKTNRSYGSLTEGGNFPAAGSLLDVQATVNYKSQFTSFGWTGDVHDLAANKTLMNAQTRVIRDATESFDERQNFFCFGNGNGSLGVVDSISSNDITMLQTVANPYGAFMIFEGDLLNAYDQSGAAYRSGDMNVTGVARSTNIVTVDAAAGSIANDDDDILVYKGSYGGAIQGFAYHVSDSTATTWLGLSRSTNPGLKAYVHDASSSALDWDMVDKAILKQTLARTGSVPKNDFTIIMNPIQVNNLKALVRGSANVQYNTSLSGTAKADLGINAIEINGMKIYQDAHCAPSDVWGIRFGDWAIEEVAPRQLYKHADGSVMIQSLGAATVHADAMTGRVYARYNLVCKNPSNQFRIKNVNFSTPDYRHNRR